MEIKLSDVIGKIATLKRPPVQIAGYLGLHGSDKNSLRLYPQIDPGRYFVIPKNGIIHVLPDAADANQRVTVLLDPTCEVECVVKEHRSASDLDCGKVKDPCGCTPPPDSTSVPRIVDALIGIARYLLHIGISEFNCGAVGVSSNFATCCRMWNHLLRELKAGGSGQLEAEALAACLP